MSTKVVTFWTQRQNNMTSSFDGFSTHSRNIFRDLDCFRNYSILTKGLRCQAQRYDMKFVISAFRSGHRESHSILVAVICPSIPGKW
jgi:hypothetical protein